MFIKDITQLLEDLDKWRKDPNVSKEDLGKDVKTSLLKILKQGTVYPHMSYFALQPPSVKANE